MGGVFDYLQKKQCKQHLRVQYIRGIQSYSLKNLETLGRDQSQRAWTSLIATHFRKVSMHLHTPFPSLGLVIVDSVLLAFKF